jgi:signal transduction histidine kinase/ligand-binding sensor domain-containing protein
LTDLCRHALSTRSVLTWLAFLSVPVSAWALSPNVRISQYGHATWRIEDGFFGGRPQTITQTTDGYLWVVDQSGLRRFDGVHFVPWTPPPGKQLPSPDITRALAARDGGLWIGTFRGLSHWTKQDLINYPNVRVNPFFEEEDGTLWFLRIANTDETGPLCKVKGNAVRCYGKADGIPLDQYTSLARDPVGNFWLGGSISLTRWRPGSYQTYYPSGLKSNVGQTGVSSFAFGPDGSVWVAMFNAGSGLGLQQFSHGEWKRFVVPGFDSSTLKAWRLFLDRQNTLWIGTSGRGLYRISGGQVDHFGPSDGLSGDSITDFLEDTEGNLWVVTDRGIDSFRDLPITTYSRREGLSSSSIFSVQTTRDGAIWVGGNDHTFDIVGPSSGPDRVRSVQTIKDLPGSQVTSLIEDHAGRHWVGIDNTLNIYENGRLTKVPGRDGSPTGMILGITEDKDNNLWMLSYRPPRLLLRISDAQVQEEIPMPPMPEGRALVADSRGDIWLGLRNGDLARYREGHAETFHFEHPPNSLVYQVALSSDGSVLGGTNYGLIGWSNGKQRTLGARNGLPCEAVNSFVEDNRGDVWVNMQCGLVEIERNDLQRWWADPNVKLQPRVFDVFDGFRAGLATPFERSAVMDRDCRLWFANGSVMQMVDPAHTVRNLTPPPVHLEQIIADHKLYLPAGDVRLPARTRDVEIDYTALSFTVPQKVRFRYRLEGRDPDWQEAGTRRQAFYTDLRPGAFRFRVIAANNSGVWNEAGAFLDFSIDPAYYQTNWFRASCVAAFCALFWVLYRYRLYQIEQEFNANLEGRVYERTRIARELHDTLLQSFHGLIFRFQAADNLLPARPGDAKQTLESALKASVQAITEARDAVHELRSSTVVTNDLAAAVTALGDELAARHATSSPSQDSPRVLVEVEGTPQDLNPLLRDEIYRIAGEAMRNAFRHARARRIEVEIRYDNRELRVRVRDDGSGIDPSVLSREGRAGHWGLTGMRERAERIGGNLDLWSELGAGTEVELRIPASIAYQSSARRGFRLFRK